MATVSLSTHPATWGATRSACVPKGKQAERAPREGMALGAEGLAAARANLRPELVCTWPQLCTLPRARVPWRRARCLGVVIDLTRQRMLPPQPSLLVLGALWSHPQLLE